MKKPRILPLVFATFIGLNLTAFAAEFHVATPGNDANAGSRRAPLRTIQRGAELAQPGDTITVHAGTYRERVNPPRGGTSDTERIVYQAARGEKVEIKGSEPVKNWVKVKDDVWKVTLPNSFFSKFNPYQDLIRGDWFDRRGRDHHTGAVYLNGDWLTEAATMDEVLLPSGTSPAWLTQSQGTLLNVAWLRPSKARDRIAGTAFAAQQGTQNAPCTEGGECVGWIETGDWIRYEGVDFGQRSEEIEVRSASATAGGVIEFRLGSPQGELLGACTVPNTGGWQSWASFKAPIKPVSGIQTLCLAF